MKFGHHIATHSIPAWRPYYVSYKRLKQILKRLEKVSASHPVQTLTATPSTSTQAPEQEWTHRTIQDEFFKTLEEEVDKVEWFYLHKLDECQRMLEGLLVGWFWTTHNRPFQSSRIGNDDASPTSSSSSSHSTPYDSHQLYSREALQKHLVTLLGILRNLVTNYLPLNRTAIVKIMKKHDKLEASHGGAATKQAIIDAIRRDRKFWNAEKSDLGRIINEVKAFKWEMKKRGIRSGQEHVR